MTTAAPNFDSAARSLNAGQLVVLPTDTIYGIAASARQPAAVERLYAVRQRETTKPCIVLLAERSGLREFGITLNLPMRRQLDECWPGPTSIVLPCPAAKFKYLHRGTGTLAFRVPDYPALQDLLWQTGPVLAPSANLPGRPPATTIAEARAYFRDRAAVYIDGGELQGAASRLIAVAEDGTVTVLRP